MSLLQLWTLLQPDTPLHKRVTKQWQTIGELSIKGVFASYMCPNQSNIHIQITAKYR